MNSGIYIIENVLNGNVYVGSTVNFRYRWHSHKHDLRHGRHCNKYLQSSWNKYGSRCFVFRTLLVCTKKELVFWEQLAIDAYHEWIGWDNMYNLAPKANSQAGYIYTEEQRCALIARMRLPESRARTSAIHKGKIVSKSTRRKQRLAKLGTNLSEEHKSHISNSLKGRRPWNYGFGFTEEHKSNISKALKNKAKSKESIAKQVATKRANGSYVRSAESIEKQKATIAKRNVQI